MNITLRFTVEPGFCLPGDQQDRGGCILGFVKSGHGVGGTRSCTGNRNAGFTGRACITIRSMGGAHFMSAIDYLDSAISGDGVEDRHIVNAHNAKNMSGTYLLESADYGICSNHDCFLFGKQYAAP